MVLLFFDEDEILKENCLNFSTAQIERWLQKVVEHYACKVRYLTIVSTTEKNIINLHAYYFHQKSATDVISLSYNAFPIEGEIYFCPDFIKKHSYLYNEPYPKALLRVIVHGLLHLIGFDDQTPEQQKEMIQAEEFALGLSREFFPYFFAQ